MNEPANIVDSNAISPIDESGNPIPVTIPVILAPGITVTYTTRLGGVSQGDYAACNLGGKSGDDPERVLANRMALRAAVGADLSLISQVHSGDAVDVDGSFTINTPFGFDVSGTVRGDGTAADATDTGDGANEKTRVVAADGQVTSRPGIALGIFAADCLPVLMADPVSGIIAGAHCGRRGLERGIIAHTIDLMCAKGAERSRIVATLGPCICGDCYEVGGDIADAFDAQFPGTYTLTRFGGPGIDIAAAARQCLDKAGVSADRIIDSRPRVAAATQYLAQDQELRDLCRIDNEGDPELDERVGAIKHSLCTVENPLWYSHRRATLAKKTHEGRMLALISRQA
ncbi:Multi-copper polyphenol oxidoreductase laccase [Bifidobacterium thermophilum]|nr:Multi-copper polyphenol oxidoreductase laccase [Bifidobacterium thermophilum]